MPRREKEEEKINKDAWMVTFSDLVTLMITFFVMLLTMSNMDSSRLKEMFRYFPGASIQLEGGAMELKENEKLIIPQIRITARAGQDRWLDEQHAETFHALKRWLMDRDLGDKVKVVRKEDRFEIHLDNEIIFQKGSTQTETNMGPFLHEVAETLKNQPDVRLRINVVSSDESELENNKKYSSLWDLATDRAANMTVRFINQYRVDSKKISMIGYGKPKSIMESGEKTFGQRVELIFMENNSNTTQNELQKMRK